MESELYNTKDKWTRGYDKFQFVPKTILVEHTPCYDYALANNGLTISHKANLQQMTLKLSSTKYEQFLILPQRFQ